ncbi:unnamed protein product, partial [Candidula unifasciata]
MPNVAMNGKTCNAKYVTAEEGVTKVILPGQRVPSQRRRPWVCGWTKLELVLLFTCFLLAAVIIALIIVLASKPSVQAASSGLCDSEQSRHANQSKSQPGYEIPPGLTFKNVCVTPGCVNAASRILKSIDPSVEPCENFFDFSCGNWNKLNVIPDDKGLIDTFSKLEDEKQVHLKSLLDQPVNPKVDTEATIKAKTLFKSCLNETQIDLQGLDPVRTFLADLGDWPVLVADSWDADSSVNVVDLMVKLALVNSKILIDQWVSADDKDSEVNIIQLDQPDLGMPSADYFLHSEAASKLEAYKKFAQDVAVMLGAQTGVAAKDIEDMVNFEIELAKIIIPKEERRDSEEMYNKKTILEFSEKVPGFEWLDYLQKIFSQVDKKINQTEKIVVCAFPYFDRFAKLYSSVPKRVKVNYLFWRTMMKLIQFLPRQYRNVRNDFSKTIFGSHAEPERWYECVSYANDQMGNAVGRLFVQAYFDEDSKERALEMIHDIRRVFYEILNETDWMDEPTKKVAKEKAEAITEKIGYPDYILNDTALNEEYKDVEFYPDKYFENTIISFRHIVRLNLKKLREPVDKTKWSTTPAVVNAFYSSNKNQIMFPAAILQPPFYSKDYPQSLNYGGIGMIIGHEITHGFDDRGRQYDKNGILVQWWDDEVIKKFKERAQCIIDQYSNFTVPEVNMKLNGIQSQGENIADNGGLKEAYRAYRKYVDQHEDAAPRLPGLLQFTSDQLFFIFIIFFGHLPCTANTFVSSMTQIWCGVSRPEAAINKVKTGVHSPGRFR